MKKKYSLKKIILSFILCQGAGILGAFFTTPAIPSWYATLNKPSFSPPNWLFGPAWLTLYTLMGISFAIIWQKRNRPAIQLFLIHLFFNAIWSILFFELRNPLLGLVDIIILWGLIVLMIVRFYKISKASSFLLLPYLLWVSFATCLNFFIWRLN